MKSLTKLLVAIFLLTNISLFGQIDSLKRGIVPRKKTNLTWGKNYYFTIGIDNYLKWGKLNNAVNDAKGIEQMLSDEFGFEPICKSLFNQEASKINIINVLKNDIAPKLKGNDRLIIYYAGHGYTHRSDQNEEDNKTYLIPYDAADLNETESFKNFIEGEDLVNLISDLSAFHISVFFDACDMGNLLQYKSRSAPTIFQSALEQKKSRNIFTSTRDGQAALDNGPFKGHSPYTGFLLNGIKTRVADTNQDNRISMFEIQAYLRIKMQDYDPQHGTDGQFPDYIHWFHENDERGEMVLDYINNKKEESSADQQETKSEKDVYTSLAFRNLNLFPATKDSILAASLGPWISYSVLSTFENTYTPESDFLVYPSDKMREVDFCKDLSYSEFLARQKDTRDKATRLIVGTYSYTSDLLTINAQMINENQRVLFNFPTISGHPDDKIQLITLLQNRVKGYLQNREETIFKINPAPDIYAFNDYRKALKFYGKDHEKMRFYLDKAIKQDPLFFDAHFMKMASFIEHFVNIDSARFYAEEIANNDALIGSLTDFQKLKAELLGPETRGEYEEVADIKTEIVKVYPVPRQIKSLAWYLWASYRYEELNALTEKYLNDPDFPKEDKVSLISYKNSYYLNCGNIDDKFEDYHNQLGKIVVEKREEATREKLKYLINWIKYKCDDGSCYDQLLKFVNDVPSAIRTWQELNFVGSIFLLEGMNKEANRIYNYILKNYDIEDSLNKATIECKAGDCKNLGKELKILDLENYDVSADQNLFTIHMRKFVLYHRLEKKKIKNIDLFEKKLQSISAVPHLSNYAALLMFAAQGDESKAIKYMKLAYKNGRPKYYGTYKNDPNLEFLFDNESFKSFCECK